MPEAEPFTALGMGNGFPFCPVRVDVDDFDDWITLGGYRKGDDGPPTAKQINDSLIAAMKFYWTMSAVKFSASASASASSPVTSAAAAISGATEDQIENTSDVKTPPQRVCGSAGNRSSMLPYLRDKVYESFDDPEITNNQSSLAQTSFEASFTDPEDEEGARPLELLPYLTIGRPFAMYNSEEFIGYGVSSGTAGEAADPEIVAAGVEAYGEASYLSDDSHDFARSRSSFYYSLNSTIRDIEKTALEQLSGATPDAVNAVVIDDMHFLEVTTTVEEDESEGSSCSASSSVSFTFDGFDFYTFA